MTPKETFDMELTSFWLRWDGTRDIPFLGEIRRYLHQMNTNTLADTSSLDERKEH